MDKRWSCQTAGVPLLAAPTLGLVLCASGCNHVRHNRSDDVHPGTLADAAPAVAARVTEGDTTLDHLLINGKPHPLHSHETSTQAEVPWLSRTVELSIKAHSDIEVFSGASRLAAAQDALVVSAELALGANEFLIRLTTQSRTTDHSLTVVRRDQLWTDVSLIRADSPASNGFFGDYLRASRQWLYVNSSRRGLLYEWQDLGWQYSRRVETLFPFALDWMYEVALTDELLVLVAKPAGGLETLYFLEANTAGWALISEHPVGTQGTVRIQGGQVCFATGAGVLFFTRTSGEWTLIQQLPPPRSDIGFAERPTYFDGPGVALAPDVLLVGAPKASVRQHTDKTWILDDCAQECEREAGVVFVYARDDSGTWSEAGYLTSPTPQAGSHFGHAVATDGTWTGVGTPTATTPLTNAKGSPCLAPGCAEGGVVDIYLRATSNRFIWNTQLTASLPKAYDYFGDTVAIAEDTLLVGAPGFDRTAAPGDTFETNEGGIFAAILRNEDVVPVGLFTLPETAPYVYPFPEHLHVTGQQILVSANTAPYVGASESLDNAGLVYVLR